MITFNDEQEIWVKLLLLAGAEQMTEFTGSPEEDAISESYGKLWEMYADVITPDAKNIAPMNSKEVMKTIDKVLRTAIFKE